MSDNVKCPDCGGRGYIEESIDDEDMVAKVECETCGGSGTVEE